MQEENIFARQQQESADAYLWRLGSLKQSADLDCTWLHLANILNGQFGTEHSESFWRKRYKRMSKALEAKTELRLQFDEGYSAFTRHQAKTMEKLRVIERDENARYAQLLRKDARYEDFISMLTQAIEKVEPFEPVRVAPNESGRAVYAMLSDIHYGLCFRNVYSQYNPQIAADRVLRYAQYIRALGEKEGADTCYISLMGDLISGGIHQTIRVENRENVVQQVIGVSELVAAFLHEVSQSFAHVVVNCVSGNHSRLDLSMDNVLRGERLDAIVPWYCKTRLSNIEHIEFVNNDVEETIGIFDIYGKTYVSVHGDMDNDLRASAVRISNLIGRRIDYFLAGHLHVGEMRMEDTGFIRNGAVVSGGDDYTAKKRLFGPAVQVCMVVNDQGVQSIHPVQL